MHVYPDCTLVTACYNFNSVHKGARTQEELMQCIQTVIELPFYLVIYCDSTMTQAITHERQIRGLADVTRVYEVNFEHLWSYQFLDRVKANRIAYHPTKDERTSAETHLITCNKFDFVLQTMQTDPFSTRKFAWIDSLVRKNMMNICENYTHTTLYKILTSVTEKFHIQVLNVCDKKYKEEQHKREYYQQYRWLVCGGFFTCGKEIGTKVLTRLKEIVTLTTHQGYGHGEEMFYLEVLDEYYDDIVRSYGDYGQILNNFLAPTKNIHYIVNYIVKGYSSRSYHRECYDCCKYLIRAIESFDLHVSYDRMVDIYFYSFLSAFYYKREEAKGIVEKIYLLCEKNPYFHLEFQKNKEFYTQQFSFV